MAPDAVVTEWLPAARRRALEAVAAAPAVLAALNYVRALAIVTLLLSTLQEFALPRSVAIPGQLAVIGPAPSSTRHSATV